MLFPSSFFPYPPPWLKLRGDGISRKKEMNQATFWLRLEKGKWKKNEMEESTLVSSLTFFRANGNEFCSWGSAHGPVAKWDSHLQGLFLHASKHMWTTLCAWTGMPSLRRVDIHRPLPDFALLTRINRRRHTEISNFVHRQVSKLAKVNENLLVVLQQALFEVKMQHINYFQQKWGFGAIQSQL